MIHNFDTLADELDIRLADADAALATMYQGCLLYTSDAADD